MLDSYKNFVKSTLTAGIIASDLTVNVADGTRFPTVPFNATIWDSADFPDPSDDPSVEIVRVTLIVGNTLTITRAQEGTGANVHNLSGKTYSILAGLTAKALNTDLPPLLIPAGGTTAQVLSKTSNADNAVGWSDGVAGPTGAQGPTGATGPAGPAPASPTDETQDYFVTVHDGVLVNPATYGTSQLPTLDERDALQGTAGDPSNTNRYVTSEDLRLVPPSSTGQKLVSVTNGVLDNPATIDPPAAAPSVIFTAGPIGVGNATVSRLVSATRLGLVFCRKPTLTTGSLFCTIHLDPVGAGSSIDFSIGAAANDTGDNGGTVLVSFAVPPNYKWWIHPDSNSDENCSSIQEVTL